MSNVSIRILVYSVKTREKINIRLTSVLSYRFTLNLVLLECGWLWIFLCQHVGVCFEQPNGNDNVYTLQRNPFHDWDQGLGRIYRTSLFHLFWNYWYCRVVSIFANFISWRKVEYIDFINGNVTWDFIHILGNLSFIEKVTTIILKLFLEYMYWFFFLTRWIQSLIGERLYCYNLLMILNSRNFWNRPFFPDNVQ